MVFFKIYPSSTERWMVKDTFLFASFFTMYVD